MLRHNIILHSLTPLDKSQNLLYSKIQKMPNNVGISFTVTDACRITKITYRRLDYWDRIGLVHPSLKPASGKGSRRFYSIQDLVELKIISRLLGSNLSLQRIRRSFAFIRSFAIPMSELVIVSDGETIYVCKSNDLIVDTLRHGQTVLKLIVADLLREVEEQVFAPSLVGGQLPEEIDSIPVASQVGR